MEVASNLLPIILYTLLSILVVFVIVFIYKLTKTLDKANTVLDDIETKVHKLDNLFEIIDKSADTISIVTDKLSGVISSSILKFFKKKRKDDYYE